MSASLPETRARNSSREGRSSPVQYSTSKCSESFRRGSSNKTWVQNSFGLLTWSSVKKQLGRVPHPEAAGTPAEGRWLWQLDHPFGSPPAIGSVTQRHGCAAHEGG